MKKTIATLAMALVGSSAFAGSLAGRTLTCQADSEQYGQIDTVYIFAADGSNRVFESSSEFGTEIDSYRFFGSKILIAKPDNTVAYKIANEEFISGSYSHCVNPGMPDGNSRPVCEHITDICTLK